MKLLKPLKLFKPNTTGPHAICWVLQQSVSDSWWIVGTVLKSFAFKTIGKWFLPVGLCSFQWEISWTNVSHDKISDSSMTFWADFVIIDWFVSDWGGLFCMFIELGSVSTDTANFIVWVWNNLWVGSTFFQNCGSFFALTLSNILTRTCQKMLHVIPSRWFLRGG